MQLAETLLHPALFAKSVDQDSFQRKCPFEDSGADRPEYIVGVRQAVDVHEVREIIGKLPLAPIAAFSLSQTPNCLISIFDWWVVAKPGMPKPLLVAAHY
jgi:hypothetical protein